MMKICFVLGNGKSRKNINVEKLKKLGTVIACNGAYLDTDPDYLVCTDPVMVQEVASSGYPQKKECFFRDWKKLPIDAKDLICASDMSENVVDTTAGCDEFVMCGHHDEFEQDQSCSAVFLIGVPKGSKAKDINDDLGIVEIPENSTIGRSYEFCGPLAVRIAAEWVKADVVYLLGFDGNPTPDKINNLYAGKQSYLPEDAKENDKLDLSFVELFDAFALNPKTHFIRIVDSSCERFAEKVLDFDIVYDEIDIAAVSTLWGDPCFIDPCIEKSLGLHK